MTDTPPRLYLASASPRRRELLRQIGLAHEVLRPPAPPGEDEPRLPGESPAGYVLRTAREKAQRGAQWMRSQGLPALPILAADTTVILDDQILGKPADRADALRILETLSGTTHEVRTAVVLVNHSQSLESVCVTQVTLRATTAAERERYCDSGEPFGKAGAYGIQGLAGVFIERITGSYSGVMGLPIFETARLLAQAGIALP